MIEEKKQKKNKVIKTIALLGLFLMVFGISYALFKVTLNGNKTNRIKSAKFDVKLTDKNGNDLESLEGEYGINLVNAIPTEASAYLNSDDGDEFYITNNGNVAAKYELYINPKNTSNLDPKYIKYNLERTDTGEILSYNYNMNMEEYDDYYLEPEEGIEVVNILARTRLLKDIKINKDGTEMYKIDLGVIGPNTTQKYKLKLWLAYAVSDESAMEKTFEGNLKLYASQTTGKDAYPIHEVYLGDDETKYENMFVKYYSDDSIRFSGGGPITEALIESDVYQNFINKIIYDEDKNVEIMNQELSSLGYESNFTTFDEVFEYIDQLGNDELDEYFNELIETSGNDKIFDMYFESGIQNIGVEFHNSDGLFEHYNVRNLYISKSISDIQGIAFQYCSKLETVTFLEVTDPFVGAANSLVIETGVFRDCENLNKVILLDNVKRLGSYHASTNSIIGDPFRGCTKAEITINTPKNNIIFSEGEAFKDVKSVTWVNG